MCQDNGEPAASAIVAKSSMMGPITKQRTNTRDRVLPLDEEPKADDELKETEELPEDYREWFHADRFYSRSTGQKSMMTSHEAHTFI